MLSATKNSVTKKSRMLAAFAITSRLYGKVESETPAISAPISRESPMMLAAAERKKHQARAETSTSSGAFATERNRRGSMYRATASDQITSRMPLSSEASSGDRSGLEMFGCTASIATAQ